MAEEGENQPKISQKSEECVEEGGEDRISALQDCVLVEILSRLPSTKEAIRTGTLSKRWENVWTSVSTLRFRSTDYHFSHRRPQNPNSRFDFFLLVDKTILQLCRQVNIKKFEVASGYDSRFESRVNNWIYYAITSDVEELTLKFRDTDPRVLAQLDQRIFTCSCLINLRLLGCDLNPTGAVSWRNLKSLCIDWGNLDDGSIQKILCGSPVLESLELGYGHGYKKLNITSKSLKKLVIHGYMDRNPISAGVDVLKINAPNILSLKIRRGLGLEKVLLLNVSCLMEANLDFTKLFHVGEGMEEAEEGMLKSFIQNLGHVKEITIGGACSEFVSRLKAKGFVFPSNIKFLETVNWSDSDSD